MAAGDLQKLNTKKLILNYTAETAELLTDASSIAAGKQRLIPIAFHVTWKVDEVVLVQI